MFYLTLAFSIFVDLLQGSPDCYLDNEKRFICASLFKLLAPCTAVNPVADRSSAFWQG